MTYFHEDDKKNSIRYSVWIFLYIVSFAILMIGSSLWDAYELPHGDSRAYQDIFGISLISAVIFVGLGGVGITLNWIRICGSKILQWLIGIGFFTYIFGLIITLGYGLPFISQFVFIAFTTIMMYYGVKNQFTGNWDWGKFLYY